MSDLVDHLFPCRDHVDRGAASEFAGVNYWRDPIPALSEAELALVSGGSPSKIPAVTAAPSSGASTTSAPTSVSKMDLKIEIPKQ